MIFTIPFHPSSPVSFDKLSVSLKKLGLMTGHTLMVVTLQAYEEEAYSFAMGLRDYFRRHLLTVVPDERGSMLKTSNRMFVAACAALHRYQPAEGEPANPPMLYFDPSWRPMKKRWLDELQSEFYFAGAPAVFGTFKEGVPTGPVVLGHDYPAKSKLIDFLPEDKHWRDYLACEMFRMGVITDAIGSAEGAYLRPPV